MGIKEQGGAFAIVDENGTVLVICGSREDAIGILNLIRRGNRES